MRAGRLRNLVSIQGRSVASDPVSATGANIEINSLFNIDNGDTLTLEDTLGNSHVLTVGSGAGEIERPVGGTSAENNLLFASRIGQVVGDIADYPFSVSEIDETEPVNDYHIIIDQEVGGTAGNSTPVIVAGQGTAGWEVIAGFTGGAAGSSIQNAYGEVTSTFAEVTLGEVWAGIEPIRDAEVRRAGGNDEILTHKIVMRYLAGVDAAHQIVFGARTFQIVSVINRDERNRELEILCRERV